MTPIVVGVIIAWIVLASGSAVLIGRALREADRRDARPPEGFEPLPDPRAGHPAG